MQVTLANTFAEHSTRKAKTSPKRRFNAKVCVNPQLLNIIYDVFLAFPSIVLQSQIPKGMKRSEAYIQMEAAIKKYTSEVHLKEDDLYDPDKKQPPRFVTQIQDQLELKEMENSKFECQLAPVGDPNMKVEWFFNGKPLPYSMLPRRNVFISY